MERFGVWQPTYHRTFWIVGNLDPISTAGWVYPDLHLTYPTVSVMVPPASSPWMEADAGTTQPSLIRWAVSFLSVFTET